MRMTLQHDTMRRIGRERAWTTRNRCISKKEPGSSEESFRQEGFYRPVHFVASALEGARRDAPCIAERRMVCTQYGRSPMPSCSVRVVRVGGALVLAPQKAPGIAVSLANVAVLLKYNGYGKWRILKRVFY